MEWAGGTAHMARVQRCSSEVESGAARLWVMSALLFELNFPPSSHPGDNIDDTLTPLKALTSSLQTSRSSHNTTCRCP